MKKRILLAVLLVGAGALTSRADGYGTYRHDALHADLKDAHSNFHQALREQKANFHRDLKWERKAVHRQLKQERACGVPPGQLRAQHQSVHRYFKEKHRAGHDYFDEQHRSGHYDLSQSQ